MVGMTTSELRAKNLEGQGAEVWHCDTDSSMGRMDDDPPPQAVWLPAFAQFVGAPLPPHMSEAEVAAIAGEDAVYCASDEHLNGLKSVAR